MHRQLAGYIYPTTIGELYIEQRDIRIDFASKSNGVVPSAGLGHNDDVLSCLEDLPSSDTLYFMVIDDENS
jgi:hypothetical protein